VSRSQLRWEFASIATAIALLAAALGAIALYFFRRKTRDLTLIYFGLFLRSLGRSAPNAATLVPIAVRGTQRVLGLRPMGHYLHDRSSLQPFLY
jgi:hypothetical protein